MHPQRLVAQVTPLCIAGTAHQVRGQVVSTTLCGGNVDSATLAAVLAGSA